METLHQMASEEIATIKEGKDAGLVGTVMEWVQAVQFRAIQNLVAEHPQHFDAGWSTLPHSEWGIHLKHYA